MGRWPLSVAPFQKSFGKAVPLLAGAETSCYGYEDSPISFTSGGNAKSRGLRVAGFQSIHAFGRQYQAIVIGEYGGLVRIGTKFVGRNGSPLESFGETVECES